RPTVARKQVLDDRRARAAARNRPGTATRRVVLKYVVPDQRRSGPVHVDRPTLVAHEVVADDVRRVADHAVIQIETTGVVVNELVVLDRGRAGDDSDAGVAILGNDVAADRRGAAGGDEHGCAARCV